MSSYSSHGSEYAGGGYNNPDEMAAKGWGQNYGQYGGAETYAENHQNTDMGGHTVFPRRGPFPCSPSNYSF